MVVLLLTLGDRIVGRTAGSSLALGAGPAADCDPRLCLLPEVHLVERAVLLL